MKLRSDQRHRTAGILLMDCMVYVMVFVLVVGLGTVAMFTCWDNWKGLRRNSEDIIRVTQAGERWRADIRAATGPISLVDEREGAVLRIPQGKIHVSYLFSDATVWRKEQGAELWSVVLLKVKNSRMETDNRKFVKAWRWDLELLPTSGKVAMAPLFTFTAAPPQP